MSTTPHETATGNSGVQYTVTLKPDRDPTDPAGIRRLRAFLKVALRGGGCGVPGCTHPSRARRPGSPGASVGPTWPPTAGAGRVAISGRVGKLRAFKLEPLVLDSETMILQEGRKPCRPFRRGDTRRALSLVPEQRSAGLAAFLLRLLGAAGG